MTDKRDPRDAAIDLSPDDFRSLGHALVDQLAEYFETLPERSVTRPQPPSAVRSLLGSDRLPNEGTDPGTLLRETAALLFDHSLHTGHPKFLGYITSSASPLGALGDLLASSLNCNVGGWDLSPLASEIEAQTIRWLAEFVTYPQGCGGLMVSGGNMANLIGFFAARCAKAPWDVRARGLHADSRQLTVYAPQSTHTWIQKAADLSGLGTDAIRWLETDARERIHVSDLRQKITSDRDAGCLPFIVVATAGTVSTGAVDPLPEIADICSEQGLWFHVDGAYGAFGAALPEASAALRGIARADSLALDPHKWLYSPLEAGCALVREPKHLTDAFSYSPDYYHFVDDPADPQINYYEYGVQNSRGFRALKVWLALRALGSERYRQLIKEDIELAKQLYLAVEAHPEFEAYTQELSITTFRFRPLGLADSDDTEIYLNDLNDALIPQLNNSGETFISNAILKGKKLLRTCVVNFRTQASDIAALPGIIAFHGHALDSELRPESLRS